MPQKQMIHHEKLPAMQYLQSETKKDDARKQYE